jgi:ATP-dependent Clp protease ATP-binding subunit ClpC
LKFLKVLDLERQLEEIRELKNVVVKKQKYERLQNLEMMRNASKKLAIAQEQWEEDAKNNRSYRGQRC